MKNQYIIPRMRMIWLDAEDMIASSVVDTQDGVGDEVVDESTGGGNAIWGESGIWGK